MKAIDVLIKYWGHTKFRLNQEKIIKEVSLKRDTLALLPTGGGKSICYQVPTLMNEGVCIVISPLISLMKDQVQFLKSKGIKSVSITSGMHYNQIDTALTNCIYGGIKFLYLSPEKLQNELVKARLLEMNISLIAVDEAHCISEWGHNFRPYYRNISAIKEIIPNAPILALTATATKNVIIDIQNNLGFKNYNLIKSSFFRSNISYVVDNTNNKQNRLLELVEKIKSSVIIYVDTRRSAEEVNELLTSKNYSSSYYHAGISEDSRSEIQDKWFSNQIRIIVATNAFGMGIDKPDVKLVVHMQSPESLESYYQQAGRAGRNGEKAYAFLLANNVDIKKQEKYLDFRYPNIDKIREVYQKIANFLQIAENELPEDQISFNIDAFCNRYSYKKQIIINILNYLEKEEYLKLDLSNRSFTKIKIIIDNSKLYKFQIANRFYDKFIKLMLRSYPNIFNTYVLLIEEEISKKLNINHEEIHKILKKLEQLEIIEYKASHNESQITYLRERKDVNQLFLDERTLNKRRLYDKQKLTKISSYICQKKLCRSIVLLNYFGEEDSKKCYNCDVCINEKRSKIKDKNFSIITNHLSKLLKNTEMTFSDICRSFPKNEEQELTDVIKYLFDNDKIGKYGNKYHLK